MTDSYFAVTYSYNYSLSHKPHLLKLQTRLWITARYSKDLGRASISQQSTNASHLWIIMLPPVPQPTVVGVLYMTAAVAWRMWCVIRCLWLHVRWVVLR